MGIPGLFKNCIQKYNNLFDNKIIQTFMRETITKLQNESTVTSPVKNHLFLDFNCAVYYALKPEMKSEEVLITHTLAYLDTLCKLVPNLDLLYIAILNNFEVVE